MKPVIAQRRTTCHYCKETIMPGDRRLTDVVGRKIGEKIQYTTRHFHFYVEDQPKSCLELWAESIFDTLPTRFKSNNPRGRPSLGLTKEQTVKRGKILKSIQNQIRYYIVQGNLNLTQARYLTEISVQDVRRAQRFRDNLTRLVEELESVGGVPKKYRKYVSEDNSTNSKSN